MVSRFLKIKCPRCRISQVTFGNASTCVKCRGCNILLVQTQGGKSRIKASIEKLL